MKTSKFVLAAAAAFMATATLPSVASAAVSVTQDITTDADGFSDHFYVSGIDKGAFFTSFNVPTSSAGTFDISVLLNETANGITSLTALLNGVNIDLVKQGSSTIWYGYLSQTVTAGLQTVTLTGTSNGVGKSLSGSISFAAATPEPAAWILMIAGLGCVGGVMRRKRSNLALA